METTNIDEKELRRLYETEDLTNKQIAEKLGCSESHIKHLVRRLKLVKYNKFSFLTKELLEDLYVKQDLSMQEIAQKLGVKKHNIQSAVEKYKLKKELKNVIPEDQLRALVSAGYPVPKIAKELGYSEGIIRKRCSEFGINANRDKLAGLDEKIKELYLEGWSLEKIGRKFNCTGSAVRYKLKRLGVYVSKRGSVYPKDDKIVRKKDVDAEELKRLISLGKTYSEISEIMGINKTLVGNLARDLKIKTPNVLSGASYEVLYDLYINKDMSAAEIGKIYNCSRGSVSRKLKALGIEKVANHTISEEQLREVYIEEGSSIRKMSKKLNLPEKFISRKIKEYGLEKSTKYSFLTEDLLREMYIEKGMNAPEIGKELNIPQTIIYSKVYVYNLTSERDPEDHLLSVLRSYQKAHIEGRSKGEKELEELFPTLFLNTFRTIHQELDLYYPDKGVAIEYNGDYWHSDQGVGDEKKAKKHILKMNLCEKKGIQLFNIFERFWRDPEVQPKIVNILKSKLTPEKLKDVDGNIRLASSKEQELFENCNNISNYKKSDLCIGVYNQCGELINSLSFKCTTEQNYKIERFTTRIGYEENYKELFEHFVNTYHPKEIEVECDRRYYNKSVFESMGFQFIKNKKAEFSYIKGLKSISRTTYNKDPEKYSGYSKIYDCGKIVLKYKA